MDNYNTVAEFIKRMRVYLEFFKAKPCGPLKPLSKRDCEDYRDILVPALSGGGALAFRQLKYSPQGQPKTVTEIAYTPPDVAAIVTGATEKIKEFEAAGEAEHKKVLMVLESVEKKIAKPEAKRTHDYGIIESISPKPLRILWLSELDQAKVKNQTGNPFKLIFVVDVNVETVHGEPKAYRIINLHDIMDEG